MLAKSLGLSYWWSKSYPFDSIPAVVNHGGKFMFRSHTVVDIDDFYVCFVTHVSAPCSLALKPTKNPTACNVNYWLSFLLGFQTRCSLTSVKVEMYGKRSRTFRRVDTNGGLSQGPGYRDLTIFNMEYFRSYTVVNTHSETQSGF